MHIVFTYTDLSLVLAGFISNWYELGSFGEKESFFFKFYSGLDKIQFIISSTDFFYLHKCFLNLCSFILCVYIYIFLLIIYACLMQYIPKVF